MIQKPAIRAEGVRQTFGDIVALDGLDLDVEAGTVFGLLGPNGAGKTTLVRVLATLQRPTSGRASVLGHDVVAEPLAVRPPSGLPGPVAGGGPGAPAPGPSLVGRPPVLLLDEPTTGLDPRTRQELWSIVEELRREGTTVLLTTQYLEEADRLAGRIAVVDHGRIAAEGTAAQLKATVGLEMLAVRLTDAASAADAAATLADLAAGDAPLVDTAAGEIRLAVSDASASAEAVRPPRERGLP